MNCLRCLDKGKIFYGPETIGGQKEREYDGEFHRLVKIGAVHIILDGFRESPNIALKEVAALLAIIGAIGILLVV